MINWKVRFNFKNKTFLLRVAFALALPILAYFNLKLEDLVSWGVILDLLGKFFANPYLIGLTIVNILNIIPDPTTSGISDSKRALDYQEPSEDQEKKMKKNDLFIDVSSHNGYDITGILSDMGTQNTIIKISESTSYINPCLSAQVEQSNPIGFYHFAWFGGDSEEAKREARYFLDNVPQKVKYLCLDYEDHASGDKQSNTDACIRFMEILKENGYEPIYYSYKPFTLNNIYYEQILAKFPNSLWIAGYGLNDGNADFEYFPSMDGIRWWQYSSNPYDKNIVLLDDEEAKPKWKRNDTGWWYEYPNGAYPKEEWEKIDGIWYYFDERGYSIASRWLKDNEKWYYLKENGAMAVGWVLVNGKWYYLDASGAMVTGWVQYKDKLYHLKEENGEMSSKELVKVEGGWYYVNEDGSRSDKPALDVLPDGLIVTTK